MSTYNPPQSVLVILIEHEKARAETARDILGHLVDCDCDQCISGLAIAAVAHAQVETIQALQGKLAASEARTAHSCGTCGGHSPVSGLVCICNGTGDAAVEAQGLRELLAASEARVRELEEEVDAHGKALMQQNGWLNNANAHADVLEARVKELVEALLGGHRKLATYQHVYEGDKELRRLLGEWELLIGAGALAKARESKR